MWLFSNKISFVLVFGVLEKKGSISAVLKNPLSLRCPSLLTLDPGSKLSLRPLPWDVEETFSEGSDIPNYSESKADHLNLHGLVRPGPLICVLWFGLDP